MKDTTAFTFLLIFNLACYTNTYVDIYTASISPCLLSGKYYTGAICHLDCPFDVCVSHRGYTFCDSDVSGESELSVSNCDL